MSSSAIKYKRLFAISGGTSGGGGGGTVNSIVAGRNITVDNTDPANPIVATTADDITVVANYSALPVAGTVTGDFYWCSSSQGTSWLPGSLGGTYYSAGLYYSNGVTWEFMDVPYQATQAEVNTGTNTNKFVTPDTLTNWTGRALTVGTTTISSGTTTRILYDNAGVLGEYTLTGTGTVVAMGTSPSFTTDIRTPIVYGGTGSGGNITISSTTNATKGKILFGTLSTYDEVNDRFGIGTTTPSAPFHVYSSGGASKGLRIETTGTGNTGYASVDFSTPTSSTHLQVAVYGSTATNANYALWYNNNAGTIWYAAGSAYMKMHTTGRMYFGGSTDATARIHIAAGTATASTAPVKLTSGTLLTTAEAGAWEYNNTFYLTNSDATRRAIVLAPNATKVTAGAPYANDGYVIMNIAGTDFKIMTTA